MYTADNICKIMKFLIDNIFVRFRGHVFSFRLLESVPMRIDKISYQFACNCCHVLQVTRISFGRILFNQRACTRNVNKGCLPNHMT